ncbi:MAG: NADH-quinone oxidoreductase subunit NuoH [Deltaproteobacteria bacterium]|nr:NADH-quinone oxidoreductase subunit NuoH [Deltaproteobacteria bacterium]
MRALVDLLNRSFAVPAVYQPYLAAGVIFVLAFVIVVFAAVYSGVLIFAERRVAGRIMSRIGPNRVGPHGLLQFVADAVKLIVKEDIIPDASDRPLYRFAPYLMTMGVFAGFVVLPLSPHVIGADLNIGLLYVLAITAIAVVGVLMSGWASNSKWSLFGGMRSAAQIVSYEIPNALALLPGVLLAGTLSTQAIIRAQGGWPWEWYVFHSPMMLALFVIYFIAALAEGARIPFDLPEGESELVAGYFTEYTGFRFAAYFVGELAHTWIAGSLAVIVFLGGWQIPGVSVAEIDAAQGGMLWLYEALALAIFVLKMIFVVFLMIQLRWTLPRVRVDQMMVICWKYLLPITFVALFLILGFMLVWPWESVGGLLWRVAMTAVGLGVVVVYFWRVRYNIVAARDRLYLKFWI